MVRQVKLGAPESKFEVRLLKRPKRKGKTVGRADQLTYATKPYFLRLCLYSDVKQAAGAALFSHVDVEMGGHGFKKRVMIGAGALAEYQNAKYGDQHDPELVARVAVDLAKDVMTHA